MLLSKEPPSPMLAGGRRLVKRLVGQNYGPKRENANPRSLRRALSREESYLVQFSPGRPDLEGGINAPRPDRS